MTKMLAAEYAVSIGINTWGAIKSSQVPWPGTVVRVGIAFGVLGLVAMYDESWAELLGGAFLLASVINLASNQSPTGKWTKAFGATPPVNNDNWPYYTLGWGAIPSK